MQERKKVGSIIRKKENRQRKMDLERKSFKRSIGKEGGQIEVNENKKESKTKEEIERKRNKEEKRKNEMEKEGKKIIKKKLNRISTMRMTYIIEKVRKEKKRKEKKKERRKKGYNIRCIIVLKEEINE